MSWQFVVAPTVRDAAAQTIKLGLTPLEVRAGNPSLLERLNLPVNPRQRLSKASLALLTDQLSTLVEAGLPLDNALDLLCTQVSGRAAQSLLRDVLSKVRSGASLADAFLASQDIPRYYTGVLRSAERSGRLAVGLRQLAESLRHAEMVRQQTLSALTYPLIVLLMTFAALAIVLIGVIPSFEGLFAGEEDKLPLLTRIVLALSRLITQHSAWLLAGFGVAGGLCWLMSRSAIIRQKVGVLAARLPFADLYQKYMAGRIFRALATMLVNGVALPEAVELARDVSAGKKAEGRLEMIARGLNEGSSFSAMLQKSQSFPEAAIRLVEVGEQSGRLAEMCARAADLLEAESKSRLERAVGIINPIAILALGGLIASLILGVMLGIFSINDLAV